MISIEAWVQSNIRARLLLYCLIFFSVALLLGCAPQRVQTSLPADLPNTWTFDEGAEKGVISGKLLDLLGDPQLTALAQEALDNNPSLSAVGDRLLAQEALLQVSESRLWPSINLDLSTNRNNQTVNSAGNNKTSSVYRAGVGISWEIDVWGKISDEHNAQRTSLDIRRMEYSAARDSLISRTIQAWVRTVSLARSIEISQERIANLENIQDRVLSRYQKGIGQVDELSAAQTRIYRAQADMSGVVESHAESIRELELLVGRYPDTLLNPGKDYPLLQLPAIFSPEQVLINRPDIYVALNKVRRAELEHSAAEKGYLPSVLVSGKLFKEDVKLSDITSGTLLWNMIFSASQPLFNAGKIESKIEASAWEKSSAVKELKAVVLRAVAEVQKYWGLEQMLTNKEVLLRSASVEAGKSYTYFEKRYLGGLDPIVNMLNAKEEQITIQTQMNELQAARLINRINLALALGFGEQNERE